MPQNLREREREREREFELSELQRLFMKINKKKLVKKRQNELKSKHNPIS